MSREPDARERGSVSQVRVSYSGHAYSPAGDKGRFALPPAFRKVVKEASEGKRTLCLDKHPTWRCLVGFGLNREEELHAQLERESAAAIDAGREFDYDTRSMLMFGFQRIPFDDSGRFVMPSYLLKTGNIENGLFIRGHGRFFTLWNPAELYRMGDELEAIKAACETLVAEQDAKQK